MIIHQNLSSQKVQNFEKKCRMSNFLFCSEQTIIHSTDISNILNDFLLIIVINSVQSIQPAQIHKKL